MAYREGSSQGSGELRGTPRLKLGDQPGFRLTKVGGSVYRMEFLVNDVLIYTMNDIPVESDYHPCVTISNNVRMRIRPPGTFVICSHFPQTSIETITVWHHHLCVLSAAVMPPVTKKKVGNDGVDVSDEEEDGEDGQSAARCVPTFPVLYMHMRVCICAHVLQQGVYLC
jgi:hypothetical protein